MAQDAEETASTQQACKVKVLMLMVGMGVGGTEWQILEVASRLNRGRFHVAVCVLKGHDTLTKELMARGVRIITLGGEGKWDVRVLPKLWRTVRSEQPEIIHSFLFQANLMARVVGRLLQVPVLISSYRGAEAWWGWPARMVDRLTVRWAHAVTCCSHAVRRTVMPKGRRAHRYVTIHNGVDVDRFAQARGLAKTDLGLRARHAVIGTVCRLDEPVKGVTVLLEAIARLVTPPAGTPCQLLVVGDGPAYPQLKERARDLGITDFVVFAGERRDVERLLPLMDVFVMPSLEEGFGIASVEAMASGRPVVASAVGGILEIVVNGRTGFLVPPGDSVALATSIDTLLRDPNRAREMGTRGRQAARERFSIQEAVERHEELYDKLIDTSRARAGRRILKSRSRMAE